MIRITTSRVIALDAADHPSAGGDRSPFPGVESNQLLGPNETG